MYEGMRPFPDEGTEKLFSFLRSLNSASADAIPLASDLGLQHVAAQARAGLMRVGGLGSTLGWKRSDDSRPCDSSELKKPHLSLADEAHFWGAGQGEEGAR